MRARLLAGVVAAAMLATGGWVRAADRAVAWVTVDGAFERDLNRAAARGLRLAAISDGLPCGVAAMQAPDSAAPAATYRVVADRDLAALSSLVADGFVPRAATRIVGTRHAVVFERHTSFGLFGAGVIAGAAAFWNDYLTAWTPHERRQIWASPIQLSNTEASCAGLEFKLRLDGMADQAHDIVALLGKPRTTGGHELVVVTGQRFGF